MIDQFGRQMTQLLSEPTSAKIILACSGGMDSMCLATLLNLCSFSFSIAHCNFQLRGVDSDDDERFVEDWALKHGIPFYSVKFDTKEWSTHYGTGIQETARQLRYEWFQKLVNDGHGSHIATAHHKNDNIETFLINASRGSGLKGLSGIPTKRQNIIRPLLPFTREELLQFATQQGIVWREDISNQKSDYLRNRIRKYLPMIFRNEDSSWEKGFETSIKNAQEAADFIKEQCHLALIQCAAGNKRYDRNKIATHIFFHWIMLEWCGRYEIPSSRLDEIKQGCKAQHTVRFEGRQANLLFSGKWIYIQLKEHEDQNSFTEEITLYEQADWLSIPGIHEMRLLSREDFERRSKKSENSTDAYLDADLLVYPIIAGRARVGDRFKPFGMKGSKKISDFFNDLKMSSVEKQQQIILRSNKNSIIWILGKRIDQDYAINAQTKQILHLKYLP